MWITGGMRVLRIAQFFEQVRVMRSSERSKPFGMQLHQCVDFAFAASESCGIRLPASGGG
jgi:hypothetical protein